MQIEFNSTKIFQDLDYNDVFSIPGSDGVYIFSDEDHYIELGTGYSYDKDGINPSTEVVTYPRAKLIL